MNIEYYRAKSLVREDKSGRRTHLNPYQGCAHDCVYCDGKAENYNMHADFAGRIRVKENAPELLEDYLRKRGFIPVNRTRTGTLLDLGVEPANMPENMVVGISGGVCDVYQPAEADIGISRKLMQIVYDYGLPAEVLTKSKLVLRDLDLLKKINSDSGATVCMTVVFSRENEHLREIFEPGASTMAERFDTLRTLHDAGIKTGIWMMPILPWLCDGRESLESMVRDAAGAGVDFILPGGLTLKPGRQKGAFMECLGKHFPELVERYARLYANESRWGEPDKLAFGNAGLTSWHPKLRALCRENGIKLASW